MSPEGTKRKLTAILSADVKGYSRLMEDDEEATVATLTTYRQVIAGVVKKHEGRVVDSPGDNVLAEFTSVVEAMRGAVEIQEELRARNSELPDQRRMEFRIGINLGDVIEEEGRIYGDGVNIAARVEALADPGGICVSGTAYEHLKNKLSVGIEYLGDHEVKNISAPVPVYRLVMESGASPRKIKKRKVVQPGWRWATVALAAVVVIGAVAFWQFYLRPRPASVEPASIERMAFPLPDEPSIAVLPFMNMSADREQEYLSDGFTEQIINALTMVPELFVIARNSTFTYKGKAVKVQEVAEELGVRYVLEGSVQKAGEKIRITAQLIDAITGRHLWAERYDRDLKDIFALQDAVTVKIVSAIGAELTRGERSRLVAKGTDNVEAFIKVLQGNEYWYSQTKEANLQARKLAEEAIALDPEFPSAYCLLAQTHFLEIWVGPTKSRRESLQKATNLYQKALVLDESHPTAAGSLAYVYALQGRYEEAIAQAEQVVVLHPNRSTSTFHLGVVLYYAGRYEEAIQSLQKTIRLDPKGPGYNFLFLGHAYRASGQYEEAIAAFKKAIGRERDYLFGHIALAATYSLAGRQEEARAEAATVLRMSPKFSLDYFAKGFNWKNKADIDRFIGGLREAGLK
jgi:adenylate cyclase